VNIAIANEFSRLSDRFGIDVWEAIKIANLHPRVKILNPGPGVGGHCISVDPWFLVESAPDISQLISQAREVNDAQPHYVVELTKRALGNLKNKKIAALGLAYKPDVDDVRESPSVEVVHLLQKEGAIVKAFEPFKVDAQIADVNTVPSLEESLADADAVILLTNHTQFKNLSPEKLSSLTHARILIDTVNGWATQDWASKGFALYRLGVNKK
jgi:UDP-N-acetyl-D-mannosaminuronic acid dehydrogenase